MWNILTFDYLRSLRMFKLPLLLIRYHLLSALLLLLLSLFIILTVQDVKDCQKCFKTLNAKVPNALSTFKENPQWHKLKLSLYSMLYKT